MKLYTIKTPQFVQSFYKDYTWRLGTKKKELFLTFDDGPIPEITPFVLDELKKHQAKATFFCIGKKIVKYPKLFQRIIDEGHTIGNHTQDHLNGWKTANKTYVESVEKCNEAINKTNITNQKLFRPPYGKIKKSQAKELISKGYKIIMWSILSGDFDTSLPKETCLKNVLKNTVKGDVVVFHDSKKSAEKVSYTLPLVLKHFKEKGFEFSVF